MCKTRVTLPLKTLKKSAIGSFSDFGYITCTAIDQIKKWRMSNLFVIVLSAEANLGTSLTSKMTSSHCPTPPGNL